MKIGFDAALGVHPAALALRAQRTELLANNIANADTPNFKARDVDFRSVLAAQTEGYDADARLRTTHNAHIDTSSAGAFPDAPQYRMPHLPSLDGNTVDGHVEQAEFAENNLQFMAALRFVDGKFKSMMTAIRGE